jgi:hypothetical protein
MPMKVKLSIFIIIAFPIIVFASLSVPYDNTKKPQLALPVAYEKAMAVLGPATNQFHCVSATVQTSFSPEGEWFFTFYSTNSTPKWVTVEFKGKVHVEDILVR